VKNFKLKSYCKINLFLKVIKRLNNGYHKIMSLITFCNLYDEITISKINSKRNKVSFIGPFKKGINQKHNTVTKVFDLLRKEKLLVNQTFKVIVKKNIPHGSGLGGGSANAASLLTSLNSRLNLKLNKHKLKTLATQIGFDVPISLQKNNVFLTGKQNAILKINKKFRLNLLIVYPKIICSTKAIYKKNKDFTLQKKVPNFNKLKENKFIYFLKKEKNDLEKTVTTIYPKVGKIIDCIKSQNGCYFSRITGSGSACIGIFSKKKYAIRAKKIVSLKYPECWSTVSKTI